MSSWSTLWPICLKKNYLTKICIAWAWQLPHAWQRPLTEEPWRWSAGVWIITRAKAMIDLSKPVSGKTDSVTTLPALRISYTATGLLKLLPTDSVKDIRWRRRRGRDSLNALEAGDAVQSSVLSLISSARAKKWTIPLRIYSTTL